MGEATREEMLKRARSRIAAMKIAPCSGIASSRQAAIELEEALDAALRSAATPDVRADVIEECAVVLDVCAQDWHRIRDPGMAANARAYARKIRSLRG